ncbi:hypothetical protein ANN_00776 [Periplaneta americana]|uniref:Uncharacterized protein n=1 Tax=Periplaneta americana TaxID=6978 RepID=A0ABQ8TTI1_PERAM|nr:hypothetical protein ANN_00776 [Periplaneta americana]
MASTSKISEWLLESSASENEGEVRDAETHLPLDPESEEEDNCEEIIENSDSEESVEEASDCERDIIISAPSIEGDEKHVKSPYDSWKLLISDEFVQEITTRSNDEIQRTERMLKEYKLTTLGTLRKNKKEIPPIFVTNKVMGTALFAFHKEKTLLSFAPRNNKIVLLLSTMHRDNSVAPSSELSSIICLIVSGSSRLQYFLVSTPVE